jgi:GNAT superfamily N-acetyltransferase
MTPPVTVAVAGIDDAPIFLHVMQLSFAEHAGHLDPPSGAHAETLDDVRAAIARGGAFLARVDGEPAGCARWRHEPEFIYAERVGVLPGFRGRGVGAALMRAIEEVGLAAGRPDARIGTRAQLEGNRRFYEGLGYRVLRTQRHPRGTDTILWMGKSLADPGTP